MNTEIDMNRIPQHIAIIMDGNGRWASKQGKERFYGHQAGVETVRTITDACGHLGVKYLTLYTFSTENWNRPESEVSALMNLLVSMLDDEIFMKNNARLRVIGDRSRLPKDVFDAVEWLEKRTEKNDGMTAVVALSYSSKWELTKAMNDIAQEVKDGKLAPGDITEQTISEHLETAFMPDPDLLIRTGGELRVSNYLLWQIAYSELYFCDTYWPDFNKEELLKAIADYQGRQRRFGKTEAQVEEGEK